MRFHAVLLSAALALGAFVVSAATECRADVTADTAPVSSAAPAPADPAGTPLPVTAGEERDYELREAEAPEAREFRGGGHGFLIGVLVVAALVLVIILLAKEV